MHLSSQSSTKWNQLLLFHGSHAKAPQCYVIRVSCLVDLDTRLKWMDSFTPRTLYHSGWRARSTRWIGGWLCSRVGLDFWRRGKSLASGESLPRYATFKGMHGRHLEVTQWELQMFLKLGVLRSALNASKQNTNSLSQEG
jgi:hypothetical protein